MTHLRKKLLILGTVACVLGAVQTAAAAVQPAGTGEPLYTNSAQNTQWFEWPATSGIGSYKVQYSYYENGTLVADPTVNPSPNGATNQWANWSGVRTLAHGGQYGVCAQGSYVDEAEIEKLTTAWRRQGEPEFQEELLEEVEEEAPESGADPDFDPDEDPLLPDAVRLVAEMQTASTSMLQRRLRLGYTRAGRLIDMLERRGVISGYEGSKPRQVLVSEADLPRFLAALGEREGAAAPGPGDEAD